ncbi:ankyrin-3-like [Haliotis rubra]|uniref:ankyrin-3-like n=1 Tax=Haliotis rubra TaxID=36100 RepID=UPI001EE56FB9|nr:ankyrin-3-like [Haliotis rubra]
MYLIQHSTPTEAGESEHIKTINYINRQDFLERTPLHGASRTGNVQSVKFLISIGAEVDAQDDENQTPLYLAATEDTFECIQALLEAKASVEMQSSFGYTPLSSPFRRSKQTTSALLDAGSEINHQGRRNVTCLYTAVQSGDIDSVKLLCSKGANVHTEVLFEAVMKADIDIMTQLFENGAEADITDETNSSLVHIAAMSDTDPVEKLVYLLREQHAPVDVVDTLGRTALFSAVLSKDAGVVEVLLEHQFNYMHVANNGSSVLHVLCEDTHYSDTVLEVLTKLGSDLLNMQTPTGQTALHYAVQNDRAKGTQMLLEQGANHSIQDIGGMTALHLAAIYQNIDCFHLLLHFKADPYIKDAQKRTVLHYLATGERSTIEQLENICTFVNEADEDGWTALHCAAKSGTNETMQYLIAKGAETCVVDNNGKTALHIGCEEANCKVLNILLHSRTVISMLDKNMRSPLHLAALSGCSYAVELLLENGADPYIKDIKQRNPLHLAALRSIDSNCIKLLLRVNVDPCEGDINGDTPLHLVCKSRITSNDKLLHQMGVVMDILNSHVKIGRKEQREMAYQDLISGLNLFLEKGANPNIQNHHGQTPLHYSAQRGHRECVEQLLRYGADASLRDPKQNSSPVCISCNQNMEYPLQEMGR